MYEQDKEHKFREYGEYIQEKKNAEKKQDPEKEARAGYLYLPTTESMSHWSGRSLKEGAAIVGQG